MIDIKALRKNPEEIIAKLERRGSVPANDARHLLALDKDYRLDVQADEGVSGNLNNMSKRVAKLYAEGNNEAAIQLQHQAAKMSTNLSVLTAATAKKKDAVDNTIASIPNIPHDAVPDGTSEKDNVVVKTKGAPKASTFKHKQHHELGADIGQMDFDAAGKVSGSRYVYLKGGLATLERAIGQFMISQHVANGYTEVSPPLIVKGDAMFGTGQLPKFKEDLFSVGDNSYLIPTAEVSLTNMVANKIITEPIQRLVALTPCFRAEAGSAGRDTKGIIRQHQFNKVEMVAITQEPTLFNEDGVPVVLDRMLEDATSLLDDLGLDYRVVKLCAGDLGFSAAFTYDIEVFMRGTETYREISSVSYFGDFQGRRMKTRYRSENGMKFVHTFNGSGLAVGRTLAAIMEQYQNEDGSITVPAVLNRYMGVDDATTIVIR